MTAFLEPVTRRRLAIALGATFVAAFAFGWPTRELGFVRGDDQRFILEHALVNHPSMANALRLLSVMHDDLYQPIPMLTFQADYAIAGRDPTGQYPAGPAAFHWTNIALHCLNSLLACLVAWRLSRRVAVAAITGIAFACHPFAMEAVAWTSGRMILLASTFSLAFMAIMLGGSPRIGGGRLVSGGLAWIGALLCKVVPTVPVVAAIGDLSIHGGAHRRRLMAYGVLLGLSIGAVAWTAQSTSRAGWVDAMAAETNTSAPVRVLLGMRYYLENYVLPTRLAPWVPPTDDVRMNSPSVWMGFMELAVLAALAFIAYRRHRLAFLGLVMFALLLLPFLAAVGGRRLLAADRYMYLPIFGLHLSVASVIVAWLDRRQSSTQSTPVSPALSGNGKSGAVKSNGNLGPGLVAFVFAIVLACWYFSSHLLAQIWTNNVSQAERTVEVFPDNPTSHAELAAAWLYADIPDQAVYVATQALKRWPGNPRLLAESGEARRRTGELEWAKDDLEQALSLRPAAVRVRYQYALTLEDLGQLEDARHEYRAILEASPDFFPAITALARNHRAAGDMEAAAGYYEQAIAVNPFHRDCRLALADILTAQGRWDRAETIVQEVLALDPADGPARLRLGIIQSNRGQLDEALRTFDDLIQKEPDAVAALLDRAGALIRLNRPADAERDYRAALRADRANLDAADALHELLRRQSRWSDMIDLWNAQLSGTARRHDVRARLTWAYLFAGRPESAAREMEHLRKGSASRNLAEWAFAWQALRDGDEAKLAHRLNEIDFVDHAGPPADASLATAAFADLPPEVRQSPAGIYTLARLLCYQGRRGPAVAAAQQVLQLAPNNRWASAARELLAQLGHTP